MSITTAPPAAVAGRTLAGYNPFRLGLRNATPGQKGHTMKTFLNHKFSFAVAMLLAGMGCTTDMSSLSPEARTAIETRFPDGKVHEVERELSGLYEVELEQADKSFEVKLHNDGTILEIETEIPASDLPKPVADAVAAKGGQIVEAEKVECLAKPTLGGVEKLDKPEIYYEVEYLLNGFEHEIKVNPDGSAR
jgi:hypothetical protein